MYVECVLNVVGKLQLSPGWPGSLARPGADACGYNWASPRFGVGGSARLIPDYGQPGLVWFDFIDSAVHRMDHVQ